MSLSLLTAPAAEPLLVADLAAHLHLDSDNSAEDAYLTTLIEVARHSVEAHTSRALIDQTWTLKLDGFPFGDSITLPKAPLDSVTSVVYVDENGTSQTWAASNYTTDAPAGPWAAFGALWLAYGIEWPTTRSQRHSVTITFKAGYGTAGSDVPGPIKQSMLLIAAEAYARREIAIVGASIATVPLSVERLLASSVVGGW